MGLKLAEMHHKPIFIKSRDGCPEFEKLRNKNIFGLEDFSGPKKSEYFAFFIFETKKHYTVPIGGLWPEIKSKNDFQESRNISPGCGTKGFHRMVAQRMVGARKPAFADFC